MGKRGDTAASAAQDQSGKAGNTGTAPARAKSEGAASGEGKGSGAARPRKWNYGITPEAKIVRQTQEANVKKDIEKSWLATEGDPTVAQFMSKGGDRHGLRVLSRRELIKLVHEDGTEYPQKAEAAPAVEPAAE